MSTNLTCDENSRHTNAERYVARRMAAPEADAFEDHFVTCADCQREVRLASAVISGLLRTSDATPSRMAARRMWIGGGLALAAGLAALLILRVESRNELVALGAVREPPVYLGIPVRGADARPDTLFEAAMDSYATRRYAAAAAGLRAALAAGEDSVPAQFFLAASLLFDNRATEAADEFQHVLAHGETPYRAEARYYRAKALLRLSRRADAQAELAKLTSADGVVYDMSKALADSITNAPKR